MTSPVLRRRFVALFVALGLLGASCGGSAASDSEASSAPTTEVTSTPAVEPTADSEVVDTEPTGVPEPTPVPEPTEADEPTVEAEPTSRDFSAVTAVVAGFVEERGLTGAGLVIVERDEGVLYHEQFGEFTEDRISLIASSSKMISAGVLLKLQEQGLLDIDAPVSEVAGWETGGSEITPAQLVSNSSGLVGLGPDLLYLPYLCQWGPNQVLQECASQVISTPDDDEDVVPPDSEFRYGGAQWQVAGAVAEAASGKSWAELIDEIYVEPCGVDSLGYISLGSVVTGGSGYPTVFGGDPSSVPATTNPSIEGGAYITSGDYAELLLLHLRGGACGDNQVLSQDSLDTMHADRIAAAYDGYADVATGYGMGWWVDRDTGRISDAGAWGSVPWLDLDDGYGAYLVIEDSSATGIELAALIEDLVHAAVTGR